jgi:hypothetical protein
VTMNRKTSTSNYLEPSEEVSMRQDWFFTTDISIAGCRGHVAEMLVNSDERFAEQANAFQVVDEVRQPLPMTNEHDEEPQWPSDRYFKGNDIY